MTLSSISSQIPRLIDQNAAVNPRLQAEAGDSGTSTMMKVVAVALTLIASIGAFVALGPIVGIVTMIVCGLGLMALFNSCCSGSHQHQGGTWFMHGRNAPQGNNNGPHVNVGRGHFQPQQPQGQNPHVNVGGGHFQPQQPQGQNPHVNVGGGHFQQQQPFGHNPHQGHIGVGQGHGHGNHGNVPNQLPTPTGPTGHVGVGTRNNQ